MPVGLMPNEKCKKIAYKIMGLPKNKVVIKKHRKSDMQIRDRITFEDTQRGK